MNKEKVKEILHGKFDMLLEEVLNVADQNADDETFDGYHTIGELYRFRLLYNAALFNLLAKYTNIKVIKSRRHDDGEECFGGGWFIVQAQLPTGQISNHYEIENWNLFQIPVVAKADKWDGHTPMDVANRLENFCKEQWTKNNGQKCNHEARGQRHFRN